MSSFDFRKANFDKANIEAFLKYEKVDVSLSDKALLISIFDECDTESEGNSGADGQLNQTEANRFIERIQNELGILHTSIKTFYTGFARARVPHSLQGMPFGKQLVPIKPSQILDSAKADIRENMQLLGLTEDEVCFIEAAIVENDNYGAGKVEDGVLVMNDNQLVSSKAELIKILIHEATHYSKSSILNTWEEEYECEKRAVLATAKLVNKDKKDDLEDFSVWGSASCLAMANDKEYCDSVLQNWLQTAYPNRPESLSEAKTSVNINKNTSITFQKGDVVLIDGKEYPIGDYFLEGINATNLIQLVIPRDGRLENAGVMIFDNSDTSGTVEKIKGKIVQERVPKKFVILREGKVIKDASGIIYM